MFEIFQLISYKLWQVLYMINLTIDCSHSWAVVKPAIASRERFGLVMRHSQQWVVTGTRKSSSRISVLRYCQPSCVMFADIRILHIFPHTVAFPGLYMQKYAKIWISVHSFTYVGTVFKNFVYFLQCRSLFTLHFVPLLNATCMPTCMCFSVLSCTYAEYFNPYFDNQCDRSRASMYFL